MHGMGTLMFNAWHGDMNTKCKALVTWIRGWISLCTEVTRRLVIVVGDT